ncbi:hypothetical protein MBM09_05450 [Flaviramulus sp. BrNp1-15]|uniref:hypothetical protein n=1 Tax=Flaviramulus sp. BrNp1-15 TaxID=2916754 RepID=UPI001EE8EED5|nr:hypothetical protein [Flaviramulus sp. BrNp1-15]ULC60432.1 hypothetical protein MBM09_05450 [Flaviramulus sp. BrNp1-15]
MSFGVVQSAISSIKYNKSLLSKRSKLKNTLSGKKSKKFEGKSSDATDYELKKLRDKLKQEHKQIRVKQFLAVTLVMLILLAVFIYYF